MSVSSSSASGMWSGWECIAAGRISCGELAYRPFVRVRCADLLMTPVKIGDILDHYRIDAVVARSGMASIFRATDLNDGKQVAIKVPHEEMEADPVLYDRFQREAEIGRMMNDPGVMKVYDGEKRSRVYMAMEWVEG